MSVEPIYDKIPQQIYNKHTTYENTVLQEHHTILSSLKDTETKNALLESMATHYIGLCLKENAVEFIRKNYSRVYNKELENATADTEAAKVSVATNRAWNILMTTAEAICINRYKIDGTIARAAVIDTELFDGKGTIMEIESAIKRLEEIKADNDKTRSLDIPIADPPEVDFEVPED